ncbi:MAG: LamG-like jellyroll fold domain-containing protein, partial [Verrucomicrobiota bacterium]|nr:LamG-like jellyroll fold domain-containing protein [Verrucomicrobiota bacterium]
MPKLNADVGNLWDSGYRLSSENTNILYAGKSFPNGAKIWWKVKTWDKKWNAGEFSEPSIIEVKRQIQTVAPQRHPTHKLGGGDFEFIEGQHGQALRFGPNKPTVEVPDYRSLHSRKGITLSAWIRPYKTTNQWQCIYRKEDGENRRLLAIGQEGPFWGLWFGLNISGYKEFGGEIDKAKLSDGEWHHVAASYNGSVVRLYVDGKIIHKESIEGTPGSFGTAPACIGSYGHNREIFEGGIDDMRVYDHGLSNADLAKLAAGETKVKNNSLTGHWKLDGNIKNEKMFLPEAPKKKRVVFVGDTLISRMEKYGYLETALTAHWPNQDITFRNLGWPGDDVFGTARAEFKDGRNTRGWESGPADGVGYRALLKHVSNVTPNAIIIGYGSSVAFNKTGLSLDQFKSGYTRLLGALSQNGATLILLTPPKQEATGSPLPGL